MFNLVPPRSAAAPLHARRRFPAVRGALGPAGVFLASRLVMLAVIGIAFQIGGPLVSGRYHGPPNWPEPSAHDLLPRALGSWDAAWYGAIASHGYFAANVFPEPRASVAFFPGWPLLLRVTHDVTGLHVAVVAFVLVAVIGTLAAVVIWHLAGALGDVTFANRTVALWAFFPGSYVLSMYYSEALTTLLTAGCLLALLRRRWLWAGVAGALAGAVQPDALVLVLCGAWAAGVEVHRQRTWRSALSLVAPAGCLLGPIGYFTWLWHRTHDWMLWYHVEKTIWHSGGGFYDNTVRLISHSAGHPSDFSTLIPAFGLLWVVVGLALMAWWRPPVILWIFTLGVLLSAFASNPVGPRPRLLVVTLPLTMAVARRVRAAHWQSVIAGSGMMMAVLGVVTMTSLQLAP